VSALLRTSGLRTWSDTKNTQRRSSPISSEADEECQRRRSRQGQQHGLHGYVAADQQQRESPAELSSVSSTWRGRTPRSV
jgi:hypothetical protein